MFSVIGIYRKITLSNRRLCTVFRRRTQFLGYRKNWGTVDLLFCCCAHFLGSTMLLDDLHRAFVSDHICLKKYRQLILFKLNWKYKMMYPEKMMRHWNWSMKWIFIGRHRQNSTSPNSLVGKTTITMIVYRHGSDKNQSSGRWSIIHFHRQNHWLR